VTAFGRIERFADRPAGSFAMAGWAAAEAIVLPVVPDVGLCLLVLAAPRLVTRLLLAVVAGALAGTLVLAAMATTSPDAMRGMLLTLPGIDPTTLSEVGSALATQGTVAFAQFGPGPPLKVFTLEWVGQGGEPAGLLVGTIVNRITRIGPVVIVAAMFGWRFGRWLRERAGPVLLAYGAAWIVFYAGYLATVTAG
jgi:hypothetical protein